MSCVACDYSTKALAWRVIERILLIVTSRGVVPVFDPCEKCIARAPRTSE